MGDLDSYMIVNEFNTSSWFAIREIMSAEVN